MFPERHNQTAEIGFMANCFVTRWVSAPDPTTGISVWVAFAKWIPGGAQDAFTCDCWPRISNLSLGTDKYARHNGGSNIGFADGQAKWFGAANCGIRCPGYPRGGTIRVNCAGVTE